VATSNYRSKKTRKRKALQSNHHTEAYHTEAVSLNNKKIKYTQIKKKYITYS